MKRVSSISFLFENKYIRFLFVPLLVAQVAFVGRAGAEEPSYRGFYLGNHQNGVWAGVEWRKRQRSWLWTEASAGLGFGVKRNSRIDYVSGDNEGVSITSDMLPRAGALAFASIPWGIFRYFGLGLGLEAYYHSTEIKSLERGRLWTAKADGFGYSLLVPLIHAGFDLSRKPSPRRILLEFDTMLRGGRGGYTEVDMEWPGVGKIGTLNVYPLRGIYYSLTLHVLWAHRAETE